MESMKIMHLKIQQKNKPQEIKIVEAVERFIISKWKVKSRREIPFCERSLDLFLKKKNGKFVSVEAKVDAPSKAFKQASRYKYISDYIYVAILENKSNILSNTLAKETGIGLILVKRDSLDRYYARIVKESKKFTVINRCTAEDIYSNCFLERSMNE